MTVEQVKDDLRRIRFGQRSIEAIGSELEQKRKRLLLIQTNHSTDAASNILRIKKRIAVLEQELVSKITEQEKLESKYDAAISLLDEIDQIIVREGYISGRIYADLGKRLGYSVRGIEYRMQGIIERLAEML